MKKFLGPILLLLLVVGVGAAIVFAVGQQIGEQSIVSLRGAIGSEKEDFFKDPRVVAALRDAHLEVTVEKAGSRQIATTLDLSKYDFVSPSGVPAAEKIRRGDMSTGESTSVRKSTNTNGDTQGNISIAGSYEVFFTPMALASWEPIAQILVANGLAADHGGYYTLDMNAFIETFREGKRWKDLEQSGTYDVSKSILINSTDVRKSNSAAMYLSLASYIVNGESIVQTMSDLDETEMTLLTELFLKQGFQASSSAIPFKDYLTMGMGKAPLVMIYEAQFLYQAATGGGIRPDMVLIYPEPTIYTKHYIIALNEEATLLGKLLNNDPELQSDPHLRRIAEELQRLEIEHGFRNDNVSYFDEFTSNHNLNVARNLVEVIDPPNYEVVEGMIQRIERVYD
jgi:hypothetical protein